MLLQNFQSQLSAEYCKGYVAGIIAAMKIVQRDTYVDYEVLLQVDAERIAQEDNVKMYEISAKTVIEPDVVWMHP